MSKNARGSFVTFASALPGALISLIFLWTGDFTPKVQWTLTVIIVAFRLGLPRRRRASKPSSSRIEVQ